MEQLSDRRDCAFAKALLARVVGCECAALHNEGERVAVACRSPVAFTNCQTMAALCRERAQFALQLSPRQPLTHQQALRLECGGASALATVLECKQPDMHQMIGLAQKRFGSLTDLPWTSVVRSLIQWQAPRRGRARP